MSLQPSRLYAPSFRLPGYFVAPVLPIATGGLLLISLLLGGGTEQGIWRDAIIELASLPVLAVALAKLVRDRPSRSAWGPLILICGILALPALQLIPMPSALWSQLPMRGELVKGYTAAGMQLPWLPVSMSPTETWRSLTSMLPAIAIFVSVLSLSFQARRALVLLLLVVAVISVGLGLFQTIGGTQSPLRLFEITNPDRAVGFFANSNHNAALLYCAVPFAAAWAIGLIRNRTGGAFAFSLIALVFAALFFGLALAKSRAGLALGFLAVFSSIAMTWVQTGGQPRCRMLLVAIGANVGALLIAFQFGFVGFMERIEHSSLADDIRWRAAVVTFGAARQTLPLGTGFGSFVPVFQMFEPRTLVAERFVNHAHNDWVELILEGGLSALLLLAGFISWVAVASSRLRGADRADHPAVDQAIAYASLVVILLLLFHSAVDYPLRTITMMAVFALACGLLIPPAKRTPIPTD